MITDLEHSSKIFLIFSTKFIGDTIITNGLVQNIKINYPESKIVYVTPDYLKDMALYQEYVDDVVIYDFNKKNSIKYFFNFIFNFKYKKPFCSFILNGVERNLMIAKLIGSKNIYSSQTNCFKLLHSKNSNNKNEYVHTQEKYASLLEPLIGKQIIPLRISFLPPDVSSENVNFIKKIKNDKKLIAIVPANNKGSSVGKSMRLETFKKLSEHLSKDYTIILLGKGQYYNDYIDLLEENNIEFTNLINKISLLEVSCILKEVDALISIDTGLMHLGYAVSCPTVSIFYQEEMIPLWAPNEEEQPNTKVLFAPDAIKIVEALNSLI